MSRDEFREIIAVIQNDIKYIVKAIDDFKDQNKINSQTHAELFNKIEKSNEDVAKTYCTIGQYNDIWTTVKGMIVFSIAQIITLLFLFISKYL